MYIYIYIYNIALKKRTSAMLRQQCRTFTPRTGTIKCLGRSMNGKMASERTGYSPTIHTKRASNFKTLH